MTRKEAIKLFGGVVALASACGCTTQAIYQWPNPLTQRIADRVMGAYLRTREEAREEQRQEE